MKYVMIFVVSCAGALICWELKEAGKTAIARNNQRRLLIQDSIATHAELEHLKRELRKCNSDSLKHKNCLIIKEK